MSNCYDFTNALNKVEFIDSQKDKTKLTVLKEIEKKSWPTCNQKEAYFNVSYFLEIMMLASYDYG